jgi:hypothetical protein
LTDKAGEDFNIKPKPTLKEFLSWARKKK